MGIYVNPEKEGFQSTMKHLKLVKTSAEYRSQISAMMEEWNP